jgi:phosphate:Na+ symporter
MVLAIKNNDESAAAEVIAIKEQIQHTVDDILKNQAGRISVQTSKHLLLVRLELELVDQLRRIYTLTKRIAKEFIPDELAMKAE